MNNLDVFKLIEELGIEILWVTDCSVTSFSHVTCQQFSGSLESVMMLHLESLKHEELYNTQDYLRG